MVLMSLLAVSLANLALLLGVFAGAGAPIATPASAWHAGQRAATGSNILVRDDFSGASIDTSTWFMPAGEGSFLGRTQLRPPSELLEVAGGVLRLRLDTYNPTARVPGDSFWGSEIATRRLFERGAGLIVRARVRLVPPVPPGLVASLFAYATRGGVRDEIDFEMLTSDVARTGRRILTNVFDDDPFSVPGSARFAQISGIEWTLFNELEMQWLPGRVRWLVNGIVVREETRRVPDEPMSVRLNVWAPARDFPAAFSSALQPARSAGENQTFYSEVDWIEIRRR